MNKYRVVKEGNHYRVSYLNISYVPIIFKTEAGAIRYAEKLNMKASKSKGITIV